MTAPEPFTIHVPDEVLDDLRDRLERTRLLDDSPRTPPSGMNAAYLRSLIDSWVAWDWRAREAWLNGHPQFLAQIDDASVHFVHVRSEQPDAPALLVMHGWPHTFALQLDFADRLPDLHVVVASLPGFAFSSPYADGPMTERRLADTMHRLMTEVLCYERYITYGEDVTANVSDLIAASHPDHVAGIVATHSHFPTYAEREALTDPDEHAFFAALAEKHETDGAYGHVQSTRPDTLAVALNDSPAGLLAWIAEKLVEWSDTPPGEPAAVERRISRDRILTEAMIYWVTQSIQSSFRPYYEGADTPDPIPPTDVPAAVWIQRHEGTYPESLARRHYRDLRWFDRLDEGGHFAIAEVPDEMADRVRRFMAMIG
ncbi:pimeloyl-ACP methyl ester carboxylesterase [Agromyces flavus]|uniref:Pimeloyl-ACP methyl ester carboxylesterase n=1 Tax=Agromyces flavus TaxID=589382 RepID=A0A1H2A0J9_9MICO|nr:epoxide hydrolase family protein [Agromyces flavus]MCP2367351.1 pimeloyl-ACP methyl ester carboxylesterase [Agromyces flavus]GGI45900.1 microsomal epoxide hydrolase [Agromyces flavus]SDT39016.1 Pimeloyl-ACP methyl ester carboxylesterase [Agromyces flavus]